MGFEPVSVDRAGLAHVAGLGIDRGDRPGIGDERSVQLVAGGEVVPRARRLAASGVVVRDPVKWSV